MFTGWLQIPHLLKISIHFIKNIRTSMSFRKTFASQDDILRGKFESTKCYVTGSIYNDNHFLVGDWYFELNAAETNTPLNR
jgi:hypothetical protein